MSPSLLRLLVFKNIQRFLKDLTSFRCQDGYQIAGDRKSIFNIWYNKFKFYWGVMLHNNVSQQAVVNSQRIALGVSLKLWYLGCEDIDECTGGATKCHKHAICTNFAVIRTIIIITLETRSSKGSHPFYKFLYISK